MAKYYAVKKGRKAGVFLNWDDCKKQVDKFAGAEYKSFKTEQEANDYLNGGQSPVINLLSTAIYVDGSYRDSYYAWAFAVEEGGKIIHQDSGRANKAAAIHNVAGELAASMRAIKWALDNQREEIIILHDYEGVAKWATGEWRAKNEFSQAYVEYMKSKPVKVSFKKVKAHSGVPGNELVDKLAKAALLGS